MRRRDDVQYVVYRRRRNVAGWVAIGAGSAATIVGLGASWPLLLAVVIGVVVGMAAYSLIRR